MFTKNHLKKRIFANALIENREFGHTSIRISFFVR